MALHLPHQRSWAVTKWQWNVGARAEVDFMFITFFLFYLVKSWINMRCIWCALRPIVSDQQCGCTKRSETRIPVVKLWTPTLLTIGKPIQHVLSFHLLCNFFYETIIWFIDQTPIACLSVDMLTRMRCLFIKQKPI